MISKANEALNSLQDHLDRLSDWMERWKIKINAVKTQALFVKGALRSRIPPALQLQGRLLRWERSAKYMRMHLDERMSWTMHATAAIQKGMAITTSIYPLLNANSTL